MYNNFGIRKLDHLYPGMAPFTGIGMGTLSSNIYRKLFMNQIPITGLDVGKHFFETALLLPFDEVFPAS